MNYALYFGLSFLGCFMALLICALILSWMGNTIMGEEDDAVYKEPMD